MIFDRRRCSSYRIDGESLCLLCKNQWYGQLLTLLFVPCLADVSSTVTLTSNYLFNGITLTKHDPALQPSLDWSSGDGWYAGLWASNVKFSPGTELEFDATMGYWTQLTPDWLLDVGVAQYTYHGSDSANSEAFNYPEAYIKLSYQNTKLGYWYASDYFGAGGRALYSRVISNYPTA